MHLVYLAGPITGLDYEGATSWRDEVAEALQPKIQALSPLRCKDYLKGIGELHNQYHDLHVLSSPKGILTRDYNDVRRCDSLIVNFLDAKRISIGTVMEIAWAKAFQKPLVVVMEPSGNVHEHEMLNECINFRVKTVNEAIDVTKALLLG